MLTSVTIAVTVRVLKTTPRGTTDDKSAIMNYVEVGSTVEGDSTSKLHLQSGGRWRIEQALVRFHALLRNQDPGHS